MRRVKPSPMVVGLVWAGFAAGAMALLALNDLKLWTSIVVLTAVVLVTVFGPRNHLARVDRRDLVVVAALYMLVVGLFRAAFVGFTVDRVLGLFLCFAAGLILGTVGPVVYQVWMRKRGLRTLGIGTHHLRGTLLLGLVLATLQFVMTLWGYRLPDPVDWVPLLIMSLVVGLFEAIFFRGFIQGRLEASVGPTLGAAGAAALYAFYHVGYGMGLDEIWFLVGLGLVYAVAFRITENVLVVWPLLTPLGAFFNNLDSGDIKLPWASIAGFADVAALIGFSLWLARRQERRTRHRPLTSLQPAQLP